MIVFTHSEEEMTALAEQVAGRIRAGDILLLSGDLGAGKTVFARGVIRALTNRPDLVVPSPTYTLVQSYDTPKGPLRHFDLYRIEGPEELCEIGWDEAREGGGITLIEWPEKMGVFMPSGAHHLFFSVKDGRRVVEGPEGLLS